MPGPDRAPTASMTTPHDPILDALVAEALADPETDGLLLSGSRAAGLATPTSDYDLYWVLSADLATPLGSHGCSVDQTRTSVKGP